MLAIFNQSVSNPPEELKLPSRGLPPPPNPKSPAEIACSFQSLWPEVVSFSLSNGNFMALSHQTDEKLGYRRSVVVMDEVFCVFAGSLDNVCSLKRHYGLPRQATEAMTVVEAYKVFRDRAPYPPDQVISDLDGKFAFILFDAACNSLFVARDRDGSAKLEWGVADDGSLVCSDDPRIILEACGRCCAHFPRGCVFLSGSGLISFVHPLHKVRAIAKEDDDGCVRSVRFQVDLFARLHSIPRRGSESNWAGPTVEEEIDHV